jgi:nitrite reductase/ring-hydroxylating ferredoxin subunit
VLAGRRHRAGWLNREAGQRETACAAAVGAAVEMCSEEELGRRGRLVVRLPDPPIDVLVVATGRHVFAVENRCPHLGSPLDGGDVRGRSIICAEHGRRFDLASGRCLTGLGRPARPLVTMRAWIGNGAVWVAVQNPGAAE